MKKLGAILIAIALIIAWAVHLWHERLETVYAVEPLPPGETNPPLIEAGTNSVPTGARLWLNTRRRHLGTILSVDADAEVAHIRLKGGGDVALPFKSVRNAWIEAPPAHPPRTTGAP